MPTRPNAFGPTMHNPGPYPHAGGGGGGGAGGGGHAHMHGHILQQQQHERYQAAAHAHAQAQAAQVQAQVQAQQAQQQRQEQAAKAAAAAAAQQQAAAQHAVQQLAQQQQHQQQQQQQLLAQRGSIASSAASQMVGGGVGGMMGVNNAAVAAEERLIVNVWQNNLEAEMAKLRDLVDTYKYIAMDTEFPGIVARPMGAFKNKADYHYQTLRCNVDLLKIIQLGITVSDEEGNSPDVCTWQFNFKFNLQEDMYAQESIELLSKSGIDFQRHSENGIDVHKFGELLISSGLVLLDDVKWISFHSGYDFGYLVKIMMCQELPAEEAEFRLFLSKFFPALYDIKFLMKSCKGLKGGLQEIADDLNIQRIGMQHQAGSDSMLTGHIFFEIKKVFFDGKIDDEKFLGQVWGLNGLGLINGIGGGVIYNQPTTGNGGATPSNSNKDKDNTPSTPTSTTGGTNGAPSTPSQQNGPSTPSYTPGPGAQSQSAVFQYGKMGGI